MAVGLPTRKVEFDINGTWTDVTAYVRNLSDPISVHQGRASEVDDSTPGSFTCVLDCADPTTGAVDFRFFPDNPQGSYYPYFTEDIQVRYTVTYSATNYQRFLGWVTDIQPQLDIEPASSTVVVTATDSVGRLARGQLQSMIRQEILADSPVAYFPLGETSGATSAADASPNVVAPLVVREWGAPSNKVQFGQSGGVGVDGETFVSVVPDAVGNPWSAGEYLFSGTSCAGVDFSAGRTVEAWVKLNAYAPQVCVVVSIGSSQDLLYMTAGTNAGNNIGTATLQYYDYTAGSGVSGFGTDLPIGQWAHLVATLDASNNFNMYVNGVSLYGTISHAITPSASMPQVSVAGDPRQISVLNGSVQHVAIYNSVLSPTRIAAHYGAGNVGTPSLTVSGVSDRVLAFAGQSATHEAGYGPQDSYPAKMAGRSPLDAILDAMRGEGGLIWDNGAGMYLRARSALRSQTVVATFDAEADLSGQPALKRTTQNKAGTVTAKGPVSSVTVTDSTLQGQVGLASASIETTLADAGDLQSIATNRIAAGLNTQTRIAQITVDLMTAGNDLYAAVLGLRLGDRIRVSNLPSAFGVSYIDSYVLGWQEDLSFNGYLFTFDLVPADAPPELLFDDTYLGRFASGVSTLNASITSSGTTVKITTPSGPTWSTTAGDYPLDVWCDGERITLNGAPSGSTSPQTFTGVTRGVAPSLAKAHSAGVAIDIADSFAF